MYVSTLNISSKGQIVLPKKIRDVLKTNVVALEINDDNQVMILPVHDLSGSLSAYNKNTTLSFDEIRELAWRENTKHLIKSNGK
jgi:bifunctional DNA-binding transcriptional regulator/antitoxin component of YhaV-PrlF toxin-antitoxin module